MRRILAILSSVAFVLALGTIANCTFLTDFSECESDADCVAEYGARATCAESVCELPSNLIGGTCQETVGRIAEPKAFIVGILLPLTGPEAGFGQPLLNAILLAHENFEEIGGISGRPLALLICDTEGRDEPALEAGRHAIEEAGVTAIIGPDFSSQTIDIATQYAIPNEVLLVTPSGTATTITDLDDNNLVWRTAPSDVAQSDALGQLIEHHITEELSLGLGDAVVWVLRREEDTYGLGLQEALVVNFSSDLTGGDNFHSSVYPTNWEDTWFTGTALQLPEPDVVVILGASEAWDIAEAVDGELETTPTYFFADAARNSEEASKTGVELETRVRGTAPQNVGDPDYNPYTNFRVKYQSRYDEDPNQFQFVANAYDALHVVALAVAGGGGTSGPELAEGMAKLSDGEGVTANSMGAQRGLRLLSEGKTIDFQGASGRLDFDENGDPSPSTIVMWCFADGGVPEAGAILSTEGDFTPLDCTGLDTANNDMPDMGTPDLGTPDTGPDSPDMSPDMSDV